MNPTDQNPLLPQHGDDDEEEEEAPPPGGPLAKLKTEAALDPVVKKDEAAGQLVARESRSKGAARGSGGALLRGLGLCFGPELQQLGVV